MEAFRAQDLTFSYPGAAAALERVCLRADAGETVLLTGPSGSGKTTLLRQFKTCLTPVGDRAGGVFLFGRPIGDVSAIEQARRVGYIAQSPWEQAVCDTVGEELAFGLRRTGADPEQIDLRVAETAQLFGLSALTDARMDTLSGGTLQLVNLAAAFASYPDALLLDEPLAQLDPVSAAQFTDMLSTLKRDYGVTLLITEHKPERLFPVADRLVCLEDGRVTCDSAVARLASCGRPFVQAILPAAARLYRALDGDGGAPMTVGAGKRFLTDRCVRRENAGALPKPRTDGADAVTLREVCYRYARDGANAVDFVTLGIPKGRVTAFLGENGAGKSTLLALIAGLLKPDRGRLHRAAERAAYLPQDPLALFTKKTVLQELTSVSREPADMIGRMALEPLLDRHPFDLSGGEAQRVAAAKLLLTDADLLLLDEPTKGMDPVFAARFARLLRGEAEKGRTVVLCSHDLAFCAETADCVGLFFRGRLVRFGPARDVLTENRIYTTAVRRMTDGLLPDALTVAEAAAQLRLRGST